MLHVKIDLVPFGQEDGRRQISEIFIGNFGKLQSGEYRYAVYRKDPRPNGDFDKFDVVVFHNREDGCEVLTMKAIKKLKEEKLIVPFSDSAA